MKETILINMLDFLLVALIFFVVLVITFKITLKRYNPKSNKIKFYGLFLGMSNSSILGFSCVTLNYIFLVWCTATFSGLNPFYVSITAALTIMADIFVRDFKRIPIDIVFVLINCLCIYVTALIHDYLMNEYTSIFLLIILGLVIIFVFMYFTYITFKLLNNIVLKQENLLKKEYKKL